MDTPEIIIINLQIKVEPFVCASDGVGVIVRPLGGRHSREACNM